MSKFEDLKSNGLYFKFGEKVYVTSPNSKDANVGLITNDKLYEPNAATTYFAFDSDDVEYFAFWRNIDLEEYDIKKGELPPPYKMEKRYE